MSESSLPAPNLAEPDDAAASKTAAEPTAQPPQQTGPIKRGAAARQESDMPWLDDPELFVSPGNPGFDGECEADGSPNPEAEAFMQQFTMAALARNLSRRDAAPPAPRAPVKQMLALLGESFAFHDENGQIFLRLALPGQAQSSPSRPSGTSSEAEAMRHPIVPFAEARGLLTRLYRQATGEYPGEPLLRQALAALAAEAVDFASVRRMPTRVALRHNDIWLDLADGTGRALHLAPTGWRLDANPPVYFRPHPHQLALPVPQPWPEGIEKLPIGGAAPPPRAAAALDSAPAAQADAVFAAGATQADGVFAAGLRLLRGFLPALNDADWLLLLAWMTAAYYPAFPRPILCLVGPAGSGKTTLARVLRRLLDPSRLEFLSLAGEIHLAAMLAGHALPVFDNLGAVAPRYANLFCRAVTGDGALRPRAGGSQRVFPYRLPILTTSLELPSRAADWLDRSLVLPLPAPQAGWRPESGFWMHFYRLHAYLLGSVLDLVCRTLARYNPASAESFVWRMADFVNWGVALTHALGRPADDFHAALALQQRRKSELALDEEPLAQALRDLLAQQPHWHGSVQELHQLIGRAANIRTASVLGRELRRLRATMALSDIQIDIHKKTAASVITIAIQTGMIE